MTIEELQNEYRLSINARNRLYKELFKSTIMYGNKTKECNVIVGQYACGKSDLSFELSRDGYKIVNDNEIKRKHPRFDVLFDMYPDCYSEIIAPDWIFWRNQLYEDLIGKGVSFNYEISGWDNNIMELLKENGYKINLYVIVNSFFDSRIRVYERYICGMEKQDGIKLLSSKLQYDTYIKLINSFVSLDLEEFDSIHILDSSLCECSIDRVALQRNILGEIKRILSYDLSFIGFNRRIDYVENFIARYPELVEDSEELKDDLHNLRSNLNNNGSLLLKLDNK